MVKQKISEHQYQYLVHKILENNRVFHFETDVMDALKFFGRNQTARFGYIGHHKNMGYVKGQPDMVVVKDNKVYFVEFKTQTGRQSPEQKAIQKCLEEQEQVYLIWRKLEDVYNFLKGKENDGK